MTAATRDDSRSEAEDELSDVRWNDRAMFGSFRGLPWWAAVLIAFVVAIVGTFVDVGSDEKTVGWVFAITFFVGCVGAVVFVERRSMFGPVVQPPLILAIVVPVLVVFTQGMPGGGLAAAGLQLGKPLIDGFPAMAVTTAVTVVLGIVRVMTQQDPNRPTKEEKREAKRTPDRPRRPERAEKPQPEDRPKRPRADRAADRSERADRSEPAPDRRRSAAPPADEDRPKRPRQPSSDRPRRPAPPREGGRPPRRRPPREDD